MSLLSARSRPLLATVCLPLVASAALVALGPVPAPAAAAGPRAVALRVGSFNVMTVGTDATSGNRRPWKARRGAVIREILGEHVDVIGVQETNPSSWFARRLVDGPNQFLDLRNGLNKAGGHFRLANASSFNCRNSATTYRCRTVARGATHSERILYDSRRLSLVKAGSLRYRHQSGHPGTGFMAWARLRSRANGHTFLFTSTHLDPRHRGVRHAQWRQMISAIRSLRHGRPVISVGDFNTHRMDPMAKDMLPRMKRAGVGDVLNQTYRANPVRGVRARHLVNAWVNSYNHFRRSMRSWSYEDNRRKIGIDIDYIFASNYLKVPEFKVVVDYNPRTLRVRRTFPSDHNMLRATIRLP